MTYQLVKAGAQIGEGKWGKLLDNYNKIALSACLCCVKTAGGFPLLTFTQASHRWLEAHMNRWLSRIGGLFGLHYLFLKEKTQNRLSCISVYSFCFQFSLNASPWCADDTWQSSNTSAIAAISKFLEANQSLTWEYFFKKKKKKMNHSLRKFSTKICVFLLFVFYCVQLFVSLSSEKNQFLESKAIDHSLSPPAW